MININQGHSLIAYSCSEEKANYTSISLVDLPNCNQELNKISTEQIIIQLVQKKEFKEIDYFQCSVIASNHLFRCGKSIDTNTRGGLYTDVLELDYSDCRNMLRYNSFTFKSKLYKLDDKDLQYISDTTHGYIDGDGSCTPGQDLFKDGTHHDRPVIQTEFKIKKMIRKATVDLDNDLIVFEDGTRAKYSNFRAFSADHGHMFWEDPKDLLKCQDDKEFTVLYQGVASKVRDTNLLDNTTFVSYIFQMEDYDFQIGLTGKRNFLCGLPGLVTEHPKLTIIEKPKNQDFILSKKDLFVKEVNLLTYINSKLVYLMRHTGGQINSLYKKFAKERCETESRITRNLLTLAILSPIDFAYEYTQGPGSTALVRGEVVYLIKCQPVDVDLDVNNLSNCYAEFPVVYKNRSMYMNPRSRLLTSIGTSIDCLQEAPSKFKIEGIWHALFGLNMKPHSDVVTPNTLSVKSDPWAFKPIRGFIKSGVYSPGDIDKLERFLMNPIEKEAVKETFVRSLEGKDSGSKTINLMNIYGDSLETVIADKVKSTLSGWYQWQYEVGGTFGFILLCFMTIKLIKGFINSIINLKELYLAFGFGWKLLTCCWSNCAHTIIRKNQDIKINKIVSDTEQQKELYFEDDTGI